MISQQQRKRWANLIQGCRRGLGWSQETLAITAGISVSYVQKIENAAKGSQKTIDKLLRTMGKSETPSNGRKTA